MRTDIPVSLTNEMDSGDFAPSVAIYSEPHLPAWSQVAQAGTPPQNPLGHDAMYVGSKLLRARSGSLASPNNGVLYFACVEGADLDTPANWENLWASTGVTNCARPAYDGTSNNPGQVAIAANATGRVQIFYWTTSPHHLMVINSSDWGASWGAPVDVAGGSTFSSNALQVATCKLDEAFLTDYITVMNPLGPHTGVNANVIYRAASSNQGASWSLDTDWPLRGRWYFMRSSRDPADLVGGTDTSVWGNPVWSGLGVVEQPDGRVLITTGGLLLDALAKDGSRQGVVGFVYDRSADLWWVGPTISMADYNDNSWYFDLFVRASKVNGQIWLSWLYEDEPTDLRQTQDWAVVPRTYEVVYSRSLDGKYFTEMQTIVAGTARDVGVGPVVLVGNKLYMISWYHIVEADATHIVLGDSATKTDITNAIGAWSLTQTGRSPDMSLTLRVVDPDNGNIAPGQRITVEAGALVGGTSERVTIGQGYVDSYDPMLSVEDVTYEGQVVAQVAKPLSDTRSRDFEDRMPQATTFIEPSDNGQFSIQQGNWRVVYNPGGWGVSAGLGARKFVQVNTPSLNPDNPGHNMAFLTHPKTLNGSIEASVRMGLALNSTYKQSGNSDAIFPGWPLDFDYVNGVLRWTNITGWGSFRSDYCAVGLVSRAYQSTKTYVLAWEANLGWMGDGTLKKKDHDLIDGGKAGYQQYNVLVLYFFDEAAGNPYRYVLDYYDLDAVGIQPGDILHLRMVTHYGKLICYYRKDGTSNWVKAFEITDAAAFGAGRFGLYGRGFHWELLSDYDVAYNQAWLWDIKVASEDRNITVEDVVQEFAWRAGVETDTSDTISGLPAQIPGLYASGAANLVLDADVALTGKAGFLLRASDTNNAVRLGITPGAAHVAKLSFEILTGGAVTQTINIPIWFEVKSGVSLPVRVSANDYWYSVWIGNLLAGTVYHTYQNGIGIGLFGSATFSNVRMSELFEVPVVATLDTNQTMLEAINNFLAQRRIKRFMTWDGKLKLSYFLSRDIATPNVGKMIRNAVRRVDRYISHCRVQGARGWAEYKSPQLLARGRRFAEAQMPDIMSHEAMYREARAIVRASEELSIQSNFAGHPDLTLEPEDQLQIVVSTQGINGDFVVDDITLTWDNAELLQEVGTRQVFVE